MCPVMDVLYNAQCIIVIWQGDLAALVKHSHWCWQWIKIWAIWIYGHFNISVYLGNIMAMLGVWNFTKFPRGCNSISLYIFDLKNVNNVNMFAIIWGTKLCNLMPFGHIDGHHTLQCPLSICTMQTWITLYPEFTHMGLIWPDTMK